jgi:hypothetical protein
MNHDDKPMWDDPAESSRLRQLLRAGRDAAGSYNVERGVVRHLANLQAGAPLPEWASSLPSMKPAAAPLLAWLAVPFLAASAVVGVWLVQHANEAPQPVVTGQPVISGQPTSVPMAETALPANTALASAATTSLQPMAATPAVPRARTLRAEARVASISTAKSIARATPLRQASSVTDARNAAHALGPSDNTNTRNAGVATGSAAFAASAPPAALPASEVVEHPSASAPEPAAQPVQEPKPAPAQQAQAQSTVKVPAPVSDDSRLEREMQMLAVAQRVLANDPGRALHLARQGEHEFAGSMFSAERRQVALLALVRLGRIDEARRLGRPFLSAYPNAPWSERLRRALASGQLPAP